jgi:hypothetical protein
MSINSFGGITLMSTYKLGLLSPLVAVGSAGEAVHFVLPFSNQSFPKGSLYSIRLLQYNYAYITVYT